MRRLPTPAAAALAALAALSDAALSGPALAGTFQPGELIFYSSAIPNMPTSMSGILRIDPTTGATSILRDVWSGTNAADSVAYDPYRQRVVFYGQLTSSSGPYQVYFLDGSGQATPAGFAGEGIDGFAPASGGRIYFSGGNWARIRFLDANDQPHTLLDASGTAEFVTPSADLRGMVYDAGTNSLFIGIRRNGTWHCGQPSPNSQVIRLPLSADGTRVAGPWSCVEALVDPNWGSSPVGLTHGPAGQLALTVTSTGGLLPRLGLVDPEAMTWSAFAWSDYPASTSTAGGTWSSVLGKLVVFDDWGDVLRTYAQGESGAGTILATSMPLGGGGSGITVSMIEIPSGGCASLVDVYCEAKLSADGCLPALSTSGTPSMTAGSGFWIEATGLTPGQFGVLFYGHQGAADTPFYGGTLCAAPPLVRTPPIHAGGAAPCSGTLSLDFNAWLASGSDPLLGPGSVVHGQVWFRDPAHPIGGVGMTDAVTFTVCP